MQWLITAGPTREYLDDVRFLTNGSSGRMGFAVAQAALDAGQQVVLISGPVALPAPEGCQVIWVETTSEMQRAALDHWPQCEVAVGAAAVCDFRPRQRQPGKIKKKGGALLLELEETPDILAELGRSKGQRLVVGFALEAQNARANALRKLREKGCDGIVLNHPQAIGAETNEVELLDRNGQTVDRLRGTKPELARLLVNWILSMPFVNRGAQAPQK